MADIRTFIAITVDEEIIARLAAVQQHLQAAAAQVSWARPEGMHITLKFLGNITPGRLAAVVSAVENAAATQPPFRIRIAGMGGFPTLVRPRVVWAGIDHGADVLCTLAGAVEQRLAASGFPPEARPFNPHLTLGRVKSPSGITRLVELVRAHADDVFGAMPVEEMRVMRSDLAPGGARYTILQRISLTGA